VVAVVHAGDRVQFVNTDDIRHTATGYSFGGQTIPENYRFAGDPSVPHGSVISDSEWSTGNVPPHGRSKTFNTGPLGTFYYACAYHQARDMRGAILVKP
jgi:plastocyanin